MANAKVAWQGWNSSNIAWGESTWGDAEEALPGSTASVGSVTVAAAAGRQGLQDQAGTGPAVQAETTLDHTAGQGPLAEQRAELESTVEQRTAALCGALEDVSKARRNTHEAHLDTIRRLTVAAEFRDEDTASHIERIGLYSEVMARALNMPPTDVETIRHAAPMHDVGKIGVPDGILPPRPGAHSRPATAAADSPAVDSVSQTPIT